MHYLELSYSKNYSNLEKSFETIQIRRKSNRVLQAPVIKYFVTEKYKPYEICIRMCNVYTEECFNQKMFTNGQNMGLLQQAWVEKTVDGVETHWHFGKKNFFWNMKDPIIIEFLEKVATVDSASHCQLFR